MPRRKTAKRARAARRARRHILLGALLMIVSPFVPNIYFAFTSRGGFPSLSGGIDFWLTSIVGVIVLIMGVVVLVGYLVSDRDASLVLVVLGGVIGLILSILGLLSMLPGLPFGPAAAFIGGLLAIIGVLAR
ncbi:MAG: hypothetical protein QW297_07465 [Candidatus Jordarchaeales archaeon]